MQLSRVSSPCRAERSEQARKPPRLSRDDIYSGAAEPFRYRGIRDKLGELAKILCNMEGEMSKAADMLQTGAESLTDQMNHFRDRKDGLFSRASYWSEPHRRSSSYCSNISKQAIKFLDEKKDNIEKNCSLHRSNMFPKECSSSHVAESNERQQDININFRINLTPKNLANHMDRLPSETTFEICSKTEETEKQCQDVKNAPTLILLRQQAPHCVKFHAAGTSTDIDGVMVISTPADCQAADPSLQNESFSKAGMSEGKLSETVALQEARQQKYQNTMRSERPKEYNYSNHLTRIIFVFLGVLILLFFLNRFLFYQKNCWATLSGAFFKSSYSASKSRRPI
nr:PREDICTED: uncharacterized protein LOC106705248 [Latimeria chalumnae]|eukprot:XP_014349626.1 PREDICTED: uncharacterized protein LOC106705248 [Latimeria chalumnae]